MSSGTVNAALGIIHELFLQKTFTPGCWEADPAAAGGDG